MIISWVSSVLLLAVWGGMLALALPGLLRSRSLEPAETNLEHHYFASSPTAKLVYPKVSVVIAAKNEADSLPHTLDSLIRQSWPNFEIIVVNDRSNDATPEILDEWAKKEAKINAVHIKELPDGWLGKNYALHMAAKKADGAWILFTDADVTFSPQTLETAMHFVLTRSIDHLALSPRLIAKGFWLRAVIYFFLYNIMVVFRPQNADRQRSHSSVGIGAFNLIRKAVYEQVGGHQSVALRSDDDLALGDIIKRHGFNQMFAGGTHLIRVEWYHSLSEMAHGLEKNVLAPFHYRFTLFTLGIVAMTLFYELPLLGTVFGNGDSRILFVLTLLIEISLYAMTRRYSGIASWWAFTIPLAAPVLISLFLRSALLCAIRGGVNWRGTFYSLHELRRHSGY